MFDGLARTIKKSMLLEKQDLIWVQCPAKSICTPADWENQGDSYFLRMPKSSQNQGMSKDQIEDLHEIGAIDNAKFEVPGAGTPVDHPLIIS